jgi:hypothetical protein
MHRHIQLAPDGVTVDGVSHLSAIVLYLPETEDNKHITLGWRFIDGEWLPPLPPPEPTEEEVLINELAEIDYKLRQVYDAEQFSAWKGESADEPLTAEINVKEQLLSHFKDVRGRLAKLRKKHKPQKGADSE